MSETPSEKRRANEDGDNLTGPRNLHAAARVLALVGEYAGAAEIYRELATVPAAIPTAADLELLPGFEGFRMSPEYRAVLAASEAAEAEDARLDAEASD
jgi:hypothetical protein